MISIFSGLYQLAWLCALPFLRRSPRLKHGWRQRSLLEYPQGPFDLWVQSASGGESLLTNMVLEHLVALLPDGHQLRVLVTSGTKQGIDSLNKGAESCKKVPNIDITVSYFPLDAPHLMKKAFSHFRPKLAVLVETELWPGFLVTAKQHKVPILLINGRMSEKSFRSYKYFRQFFSTYGPKKIYAISTLDCERFAAVFGREKVAQINNIKFDRITPPRKATQKSPINDILPQDNPFILLGSIRREEDDKILSTIKELASTRPDCLIGLFPKHIERADQWIDRLKIEGIRAIKRSNARTVQRAGTVIVWDVFGELAEAYALAATTFVGGSLINLGGQNFLEPLVFGLKPIIGPYWKNFAWVGREIIDAGLVFEVDDERQLITVLLQMLESGENRDEVIAKVQDFFEPRKGGTHQVCQAIIDNLLAGEKH
ncbi:MAG: 3-deoxy-D-manno-octulosonic acid transferase [Desulforhopalus sp.]